MKLAPVTMSKKLAPVTMSKKIRYQTRSRGPMKLRWFADEASLVDEVPSVDEADVGVARDNNQVRPCLGTCAKMVGGFRGSFRVCQAVMACVGEV